MNSLIPLVQFITSRNNTFVKELRSLARSNTAYRKNKKFWVEGDHLCSAALLRNVRPEVGVFSESFWQDNSAQWSQSASRNIVIPDSVFVDISGLESPANMGFLFDLPLTLGIQCSIPTVILDRVQDAGNVGSILRSASAFGFKQVIAMKGTAALWSPKVLRAGMGAHWGLHLMEGLSISDLSSLTIPVIVTSSHTGLFIHDALRNGELPHQCAWVLGHEGQGVSSEVQAIASMQVKIYQPGGEESLNVAAAAAICFHASSTSIE